MNTALMEELEAPVTSLRQLAGAEAACTRCPLYRDATQAVPGEGPSHAAFMLIGEQPGDKEDLAGKPFVGPAGRLLARQRPMDRQAVAARPVVKLRAVQQVGL